MLAEAWPEGSGTLSFLCSVMKKELGCHTQLFLIKQKEGLQIIELG